jgi:type IV secretion system protein TrbC
VRAVKSAAASSPLKIQGNHRIKFFSITPCIRHLLGYNGINDDNKVIDIKGFAVVIIRGPELVLCFALRSIPMKSLNLFRHGLSGLTAAAVLLGYSSLSQAATFDGSGGSSSPLPWETPLAQVLASFTGPVAKALCILSIVLLGFGFAFSEGAGMRRILGVLLGVSIAVTATSFGVSFFGFDGGAGF